MAPRETPVYWFHLKTIFRELVKPSWLILDQVGRGRHGPALLAADALAYALRPALIGWASWSYMDWLDWSGLAFIFGAGSLAMLTKRRGLAIGSLAVLVADILFSSVARAIWSI